MITVAEAIAAIEQVVGSFEYKADTVLDADINLDHGVVTLKFSFAAANVLGGDPALITVERTVDLWMFTRADFPGGHRAYLRDYIADLVESVELHECQEWLRFDGEQHRPPHGPGEKYTTSGIPYYPHTPSMVSVEARCVGCGATLFRKAPDGILVCIDCGAGYRERANIKPGGPVPDDSPHKPTAAPVEEGRPGTSRRPAD